MQLSSEQPWELELCKPRIQETLANWLLVSHFIQAAEYSIVPVGTKTVQE